MIGSHQALRRAAAFEVLDQREQRALAGVERDVVEVVEHARLGELAQLGVDEAAAEHGHDGRVVRLDRLRDAKGRVHRAGERHRDQHQGRRVALHGRERQRDQRAVDEVGRGGQRIGERVEGRLALRERFGIAHELEARVDRVAQHVGDVVQVQRGEVPRAVVQAERAEGPGERVAAVFGHVDVKRFEARALGQKGAAADAVRGGRVAALQERDRRRDRREVAVELRVEAPSRCGVRLRCGQRVDAFAHRAQAGRREQFEHQRQREVFLRRMDVARAQEAGQVGGRRVGRVELRHRRDDG